MLQNAGGIRTTEDDLTVSAPITLDPTQSHPNLGNNTTINPPTTNLSLPTPNEEQQIHHPKFHNNPSAQEDIKSKTLVGGGGSRDL